MKQKFTQVVDRITHLLGTPGALATATLVIVVWAITGPLFGFPDTWQLVLMPQGGHCASETVREAFNATLSDFLA